MKFWQFKEPVGQWRALGKLVQRAKWPPPSMRVIFLAWWHSRRYVGFFEAWRVVGAMEECA